MFRIFTTVFLLLPQISLQEEGNSTELSLLTEFATWAPEKEEGEGLETRRGLDSPSFKQLVPGTEGSSFIDLFTMIFDYLMLDTMK